MASTISRKQDALERRRQRRRASAPAQAEAGAGGVQETGFDLFLGMDLLSMSESARVTQQQESEETTAEGGGCSQQDPGPGRPAPAAADEEA